MDVYEHCARTVRELDRDRYIADLFAPARSAQAPVRAARLQRRGRRASATPSAIRCSARSGCNGGATRWSADGGGHPVASALIETIRTFALPLAGFEGLIDARVFDLYDDQMPTQTDLEGYAGETSSALIQLAAIVLAGGHDPRVASAAGHAGVAYAMTGLMRALPIHAARGQCYLPADIGAAHGFDRQTLVARAGHAGAAADAGRSAPDRPRSSWAAPCRRSRPCRRR